MGLVLQRRVGTEKIALLLLLSYGHASLESAGILLLTTVPMEWTFFFIQVGFLRDGLLGWTF